MRFTSGLCRSSRRFISLGVFQKYRLLPLVFAQGGQFHLGLSGISTVYRLAVVAQRFLGKPLGIARLFRAF
jgi:hypothetical protein